MLVTPIPTADRRRLLDVLRDVENRLGNVWNATGSPERFTAYLQWASESVGQLTNLLDPRDLERLVLTRRYWLLQDKASLDGRPLTYLLDTAISEQQAGLGIATDALARQIERWSGPEHFVVADTNFFIEYPDKLEDLDLPAVLNTRADPVHLVLPILVVDELDALKRSSKSHVRWRAAHTLAVIDRILATNKYGGQLRAADWSRVDNDGGLPSGSVTLEVVLDPPGHVRLDRPDDELVERARVIQALASRPVTLITYDTGQATRIRFTELTLMKLRPQQLDPPPPA